MKHLALVTLLLFAFGACYAQNKAANPAKYNRAIKWQAKAMKKALMKKDFKSFAKFTYPKVVDMMGGEQKMIEVLEKGAKEMQAAGTSIQSVTIGEPSLIITAEKELQCTVPQTIKMKVPEGTLITKSTLIALSVDNGKHWYFVDASSNDIKTMRRTLPNLSRDLMIPEKEAPVLLKK